jgi:hypothetical protein
MTMAPFPTAQIMTDQGYRPPQFQGPGGGTSFAGPIVANELAMRVLDVPDGQQVFVLSHRSIWTKRIGIPGTIGVPPLSPNEVVAANDGSGVFTRTQYSDPALRIGVNDIWIDPANPNASDENSGLTASLPLKTGRELYRRWGWGSNPEVGPNVATSPDGFLTIHVVSAILSPDSLSIVLTMSKDGNIRIKGTPVTTRTGSLTAATTAMNPATNTRLRLTDGGGSPFTAADLGKRGRFTNGPAAGGTFLPQVLVAAGVVDCTACQTTNEPGFSIVATTVTPANGNAYVIEQLTQVNFGEIDIYQGDQPTFGIGFLNFVDVELPTQAAANPLVLSTGDSIEVNFYGCLINRILDLSKAGLSDFSGLIFIACYFLQGVNTAETTTSVLFSGGGAFRGALTTVPIFTTATSLQNAFDQNFVSEGIPLLLIGDANVADCAVFNAVVNGSFNPGGHGFLVGGSTMFQSARSRVRFRGTAWGAGNAGVGVRVASGAKAIGAPQVVTGTGGDFALANQVGAGGACVFWNRATSTYLPVGGQALTWALLTAAKAAPGYGGGAHELDQDAHWISAETN